MDLRQLNAILLPGTEYSDECKSFFENISQISSDIFLGNYEAARDQALLESKGITHIVQCLQVSWNDKPLKGFKYLVIPAVDAKTYDISAHFSETTKFIDKARKKRGVVFVHCAAGISRSASIVIAYLMKAHGFSYSLALTWVSKRRPIAMPNEGFAAQLQTFERSLREPRIHLVGSTTTTEEKTNAAKN